MTTFAHISDTHIRNLKYHEEYRIVFKQIYDKLQQDGEIETKEEIEKLLEKDKKQKLQKKIDKNNKIKESLQKQLQKVRDEMEVAKGKRNKKR